MFGGDFNLASNKVTSRRHVDISREASLFLDVSVGKAFLCFFVGDSFEVNMMGDFMDQNIVEIKSPELVERVPVGSLNGWAKRKTHEFQYEP
jgi:hypothetical protein